MKTTAWRGKDEAFKKNLSLELVKQGYLTGLWPILGTFAPFLVHVTGQYMVTYIRSRDTDFNIIIVF